MLADSAFKLVFRDIGPFYDNLVAHHYSRGRRKIQLEILIGLILFVVHPVDAYFYYQG